VYSQAAASPKPTVRRQPVPPLSGRAPLISQPTSIASTDPPLPTRTLSVGAAEPARAAQVPVRSAAGGVAVA